MDPHSRSGGHYVHSLLHVPQMLKMAGVPEPLRFIVDVTVIRIRWEGAGVDSPTLGQDWARPSHPSLKKGVYSYQNRICAQQQAVPAQTWLP